MFSTFFDFLLVMLGFSLIILLHELGHFVAARWAGIRVLAFALGFGPAIVSYRKGLGVRLGSTEREVLALRKDAVGQAGERRESARAALSNISHTEYRWNIFPLGGYVKMLGQDDADPSARSDEPDSYQSCLPWKRMVVISAGVVMNIITAAVLFLVVFGVGLVAESPMVGEVRPGSPAATAVATNAGTLGVTTPGLQPGDTILSIDGERMAKFQDIIAASIMSSRGSSLAIDVARPGLAETLRFRIEPRVDPQTNTLALGIGAASTGETRTVRNAAQAKEFEAYAALSGFPMLRPGMKLTRVPGAASDPKFYDIDRAVNAGGGKPVDIEFTDDSGKTVVVTLKPETELQKARFEVAPNTSTDAIDHLLGLLPTMRVVGVSDQAKEAKAAGLSPGDIFARLGDAEWPSVAEGVGEIQRDGRSSIPVVVARLVGDTWTLVDLGELPVRDGKVGFQRKDAIEDAPFVARWPARWKPLPIDGVPGKSEAAPIPSGAQLHLTPGTRILAVNGVQVNSLAEVRDRLRSLAQNASGGPLTVDLTIKLPLVRSETVETVKWTIPTAEVAAVSKLGWKSPLPPDPSLFKPAQTKLKADGPVEAISMGLSETRKAMVQTYLTLARLFQGTVKVEHLKGPVGIAHVGTILAERGTIWLLFFMAAISVNLAVINFLPLPIVDGGQFLFILYEQVTGRPVSVAVQNVAALAGLALIGCMFLIVTFNDLKNLLWH